MSGVFIQALPWAIKVRLVSIGCLVLAMRSVFIWRAILFGQYRHDGCSQSCFALAEMSNGSYVDVDLGGHVGGIQGNDDRWERVNDCV